LGLAFESWCLHVFASSASTFRLLLKTQTAIIKSFVVRFSGKDNGPPLNVRDNEMRCFLPYCGIFSLLLLGGCYRSPQIPESGKTNRLKINYGAPKLEIPPDVVVTNRVVIENVLSAIRSLPHNWHGNRLVLPETKLTLSFNEGSNTLLVVWLSSESIGARQGNQQHKDNRWCEVPRATLAQIAKQLGVTPYQ